MDEVTQAVEKVIKEWDETSSRLQDHVKAIEEYGTSGRVGKEETSLQRLNGLAQDGLALLRSLQFKLDLLAQQLLTEEEVQSAQLTLKSWKDQYQSLHLGLRNANLQAKTNMRKAAQAERELLLGGGGESTIRRRNLQTKAGMTSAAESITDSLRRTRQLMVQLNYWDLYNDITNAVVFTDESTGVLRKAESEYKGHRSLLMRTRNLLSTMRRQDVLDRVILWVGFFLFSCAVLYVVSKRIGLLKLQRKVTEAIKAGMIGQAELRPGVAENGLNEVHVHDNLVPRVEVPVENMRDEL
ncbi:Sec20 [Macleaya cordata]|uniref:Sec20 n=1 Tax=Macleaya cordata TaxID=56857 RepID=A0A200PVR0_MACCD|nr:Sec20 [Macleaya cordata]